MTTASVGKFKVCLYLAILLSISPSPLCVSEFTYPVNLLLPLLLFNCFCVVSRDNYLTQFLLFGSPLLNLYFSPWVSPSIIIIYLTPLISFMFYLCLVNRIGLFFYS